MSNNLQFCVVFVFFLQKQLPKDNFPYLLFSFYILITGYGFFHTIANNAVWSAKLEAIVLFPSLSQFGIGYSRFGVTAGYTWTPLFEEKKFYKGSTPVNNAIRPFSIALHLDLG